MARLQDFNSVTPTGSDNLLIVQSQGQGLSTLNEVGQKVATETTMPTLTTTSKNVVGAINELDGITDNLSEKLADLKILYTSTTSFVDACSKIGIYAGIGTCLDNLKTNIGSYPVSSQNTRIDTTQGPYYFMWFGKVNNDYFTGVLLSYFAENERQPVLFNYYNGIYRVRRL